MVCLTPFSSQISSFIHISLLTSFSFSTNSLLSFSLLVDVKTLIFVDFFIKQILTPNQMQLLPTPNFPEQKER
jgi:hypothetical protein